MKAITALSLALLALPALADPAGVELTPRVAGLVQEVLVQEGQVVTQGQILLRLDNAIYQARVREQEADVARLTAEADEARKDYERVQELYNRTVTSTTELDAARLRHARAAGLLDAARARLDIARLNLQDSELKAPFDGVVLRRLAEPGSLITVDCQPRPAILLQRPAPRP